MSVRKVTWWETIIWWMEAFVLVCIVVLNVYLWPPKEFWGAFAPYVSLIFGGWYLIRFRCDSLLCKPSPKDPVYRAYNGPADKSES